MWYMDKDNEKEDPEKIIGHMQKFNDNLDNQWISKYFLHNSFLAKLHVY